MSNERILTAVWQNTVIAEAAEADTVKVEGNVYFPPAALLPTFVTPSDHTSVCGWKGTAHYYHVNVEGQRNDNAAWYYPAPKPDAAHIGGFVAFWRGVQILPKSQAQKP